MHISQKEVNGKWTLFTLTNDHNMEVSVLNYGGIITKIMVPDKHGKMENVVIGYKDYKDYEANPNYFGALIGRVAGRIRDATFQLDGKTYTLEPNEGSHHLHGGANGFQKVLWNVTTFQTAKTIGLTLSHRSHHGDGGYPGELELVVTYTLSNLNQLTMDYKATSSQNTILTMTNHSYFNLSGNLKNTIHDHHLTFNSDFFIELDDELIPTGSKLAVEGSTFDFRSGRWLKDGFYSTEEQHKIAANGYDHYFIFNQPNKGSVDLTEPESGRRLIVQTNQPGMVVYTANSLEENLPLRETASEKYLGICLETQGSPASLHHKHFPAITLEKGEQYHKQTTFSFHVTD